VGPQHVEVEIHNIVIFRSKDVNVPKKGDEYDIPVGAELKGDCKIQLWVKTERLCHFWINTGFYQSEPKLSKECIDVANKDKTCSVFKKEFSILPQLTLAKKADEDSEENEIKEKIDKPKETKESKDKEPKERVAKDKEPKEPKDDKDLRDKEPRAKEIKDKEPKEPKDKEPKERVTKDKEPKDKEPKESKEPRDREPKEPRERDSKIKQPKEPKDEEPKDTPIKPRDKEHKEKDDEPKDEDHEGVREGERKPKRTKTQELSDFEGKSKLTASQSNLKKRSVDPETGKEIRIPSSPSSRTKEKREENKAKRRSQPLRGSAGRKKTDSITEPQDTPKDPKSEIQPIPEAKEDEDKKSDDSTPPSKHSSDSSPRKNEEPETLKSVPPAGQPETQLTPRTGRDHSKSFYKYSDYSEVIKKIAAQNDESDEESYVSSEED